MMTRARSGFALPEAILASAVFALTALSLFRGISLATRVARDEVEELRADAAAFDLAWAHYQGDFGALLAACADPRKALPVDRTIVEGLPNAAATVSVTKAKGPQLGMSEFLVITAVVEWGDPAHRRQRQVRVVKSNLERDRS